MIIHLSLEDDETWLEIQTRIYEASRDFRVGRIVLHGSLRAVSMNPQWSPSGFYLEKNIFKRRGDIEMQRSVSLQSSLPIRFVNNRATIEDPRDYVWVASWGLSSQVFFWYNADLQEYMRTFWSPSMILTRTVQEKDHMDSLHFPLVVHNDRAFHENFNETLGKTLQKRAFQRRTR